MTEGSGKKRGRPSKPPRPCGLKDCPNNGRYYIDVAGERTFVCSTHKSAHVRARKRPCSVSGCNGTVRIGKNRNPRYCRSHEDRYLSNNAVATDATLKYLQQAIVDLGNGCWHYVGADNRDRGTKRPQIWCDGLRWYVSRFLYIRFFGPHKGNLELHHLCGRGTCVNPAHLTPVGAVRNRNIEGRSWYWTWQRVYSNWRISIEPNSPNDPVSSAELAEFQRKIPIRPVLRRNIKGPLKVETQSFAELRRSGLRIMAGGLSRLIK